MQLVLSLFPGIGLLDMAFELEGFCVVRGPDVLWGGDIHKFHPVPRRFDGIVGGWPCQCWSQAIASRGGAHAAKVGDLTGEFERVRDEAQAVWWIGENVPEAPILAGAKWNEVLDAWEFGASQHRRRRFQSNLHIDPIRIPVADRHRDPWPTVTATRGRPSPRQSSSALPGATIAQCDSAQAGRWGGA